MASSHYPIPGIFYWLKVHGNGVLQLKLYHHFLDFVASDCAEQEVPWQEDGKNDYCKNQALSGLIQHH
uniref:Uncharacterized protein n=1 Tax=Arundo donax TaxID=35708 RepID=A0A0A9HTT6_ARUDO